MTTYNNSLFNGKCGEYAVVGYEFMKKNFEKYKNQSVKVKKYYIGNNGDNQYDDYHYYLELNDGVKKYIIDNTCVIYGYYEYKQRFNPKQIKELSIKEIKEYLNLTTTSNVFMDYIKPQIITDYEIHLNELQEEYSNYPEKYKI
jgi:hypothetical protein